MICSICEASALTRPGLGIEIHHQTDIFTKHRRQQFRRLSDQGVEAQNARFEHLFASESQKLSR